MLEITIKDGGIRTRKVGSRKTFNVTWPTERFIFPCNQYSFTPPIELMPCEEFYNALKTEGLPNDLILQKMIRMYIPWYCFNVGHLEKISTCLGIIGHRGSCKTASAVYMMIFDYLIRDKPVYSNVEIAVKVKYKDCAKEYHSKPWTGSDMLAIEGDTRGGVVFVDEINLAAASSQKRMSNANYEWNNELQQLRKKQLNVIWTAQSWKTVDDLTRWQSDWVVETQDCFNDHSYKAKCPGDKTKWSVFELSGLSGQFDLAYELEHHWLMHYKIGETRMVWLRPIAWPAYDTYQAQSADYFQKYKLKQAELEFEQKQVMLEARQKTAQDIIDQIIELNRETFYSNDLWSGIEASQGLKTQVGMLLNKTHNKHRESSGLRRFYYVKKECDNDGHK